MNKRPRKYHISGNFRKYSLFVDDSAVEEAGELFYTIASDLQGIVLMVHDDHILYRVLFFDNLTAVGLYLRKGGSVLSLSPSGNLWKDRWQNFFSKNGKTQFVVQVCGTEFQHQVWQELLQIKIGTICSYQELAMTINRPQAVRAVGTAIGKNLFYRIIPCHRVIPSHHKDYGQYAWGKEQKKYLLRYEEKTFLL